MSKKIIWTAVFVLVAALLQSTILRRLAVFNTVPDLALGIVIYTAYLNGTMTGQLSGFGSGLILDIVSAAPLGFNTLIRTIIGAVAGIMKGMFFLDIVLFPMLLCFGATVLKGVSVFLLGLAFSGAVPSYNFFAPVFWVELGMNTVTAPLLFAFLRLFDSLLVGKRES